MYSFKKKCLVCVIEVATLIFLGLFLYCMQMQLSVNNLNHDMLQETEKLKPYLQSIHDTEESVTRNYDAVYQAKAEILAYMIRNEIDGCRSLPLLREYGELLEVEHIFLINREGKILIQTSETKAEFSYTRYAQLLAAFETESVTEAFNVEVDGTRNRYYGAKIDKDSMVVLEIPSGSLAAKKQSVSSWKAILEKINVGLNGFAFAVSKKDYTFLYYPDDDMIGQDSLNAGIDVEQLKDGSRCRMSVGNDRMYGVVLEAEDAYIICASSEEELVSSSRITVIAIMLIVWIVITIIIAYTVFLSGDTVDGKTYGRLGPFTYNRKIACRIGLLSLAGMVCIFVMSLYMQTLFMYSNYSVSCNDCVSDVEKTIEQYEDEISSLKEEYDDVYLNKCRIVAHIVQSMPGHITRTELAELCDVLDITYIYVYDENGKVRVTNSPNSPQYNFKISDDPEDSSYEFSSLLKTGEYVVQEAQVDALGDYMQYIGVSLRNDENMAVGFVQIGIRPEELENKTGNTDISSILEQVSVGVGGFAFAVNKADGTFSYYPKEKYIGEVAAEYGIKEEAQKDKFNGAIRIDHVNYYGASLETADYYIYAVVPKSEIKSSRLPVAVASTLAAFLCLCIVELFLVIQYNRNGVMSASPIGDDEQEVSTAVPKGSAKKTEVTVSRWDNLAAKWKNNTAERKTFALLKSFILCLDLCVIAVYFFGERIFKENSVLYYIVNGNWEQGINIFAVTACIIIICIVSAMVEIVQIILHLASRILTAKGETICRLFGNTLKYICIIAEIYYCLVQFGVDTETLLASAGILSLVIGLGAKDMVTDILAGLFIIFDGEFQVGDIVTIGDWRGTVLEIGMRTTKIVKSGNIKIINNSNVTNVINMTKRGSYVACEIGIGYGESLERVEEIFAKELPLMKERIEGMEFGPYYTGVSKLGQNAVYLTVSGQCAETDCEKVESKLKREIKLLVDKYNINIL
ncbi:MAG: mechanosensitive ion channel [Lachnospiraceae bacterium]|nr:mechanosensitive ion channel [Lachnospiraceae bacterium]